MVKILMFSDGSKNVALSNPNLESVNLVALEKLVNLLFSFYGPDSNATRQGAFTGEDQRAVKGVIADPNNGFWIGRHWSDLGTHAVRIDLNEEGLEVFIHGVPKN